jgi:hypothetical protein
MAFREGIRRTLLRPEAAVRTVSALSFGAGLLLTLLAALSQRWLLALLGSLLLACVLAGFLAARQLLELVVRTSDLSDGLEQIRRQLERIASTVERDDQDNAEASLTSPIDLAAFGPGDPSELVAARLDRDAFPRMVAMMEAEPPPEAAVIGPDAVLGPAAAGETVREKLDRDAAESDRPAMTTKDLLRAWRVGLRNGDLASCREAYAALVDTVDAAALGPLELKLNELADRTESSLREAFAVYRRQCDCVGMITVGERICSLLPDRPVAEEFRRVESHLRRLAALGTESATPPLRILC